MADAAADRPRPKRRDRTRSIATPEGVVIHMILAPLTDRLAALVIDLCIIYGTLIAIVVVALFTFLQVGPSELVFIVVQLLAFFVRSFYFAFFELRWLGATPGKRAMKLRVVSRDGGPLRPPAVLARNLMREVELFLPITIVLSVNAMPGGNTLVVPALVWLGVITLLPLFNRDRLRAGDIVGGTWVIEMPKGALLGDMATVRRPTGVERPNYRFTSEQVAIYGIYELQILEQVLRDDGPNGDNAREAVANKIAAKIGFETDDGRPIWPRPFLEAFYRAQRQRLETDLAFGRRQERKRSP